MAVFKDCQEVPVELEISVKAFYRAMTLGEKQEMKKLLRSDGVNNIPQQDFELSINKLSENYHRLTNEEEELLKKITDRF